MPSDPLEPPQKQPLHVKSIHRLPNGDVVITQSGISVQYQETWLTKSSHSVLVSILRGIENSPVSQELLQKHNQETKTQNNPYAKAKKLGGPKILTYEYEPPVVLLKQQFTLVDDVDDDDVPQMPLEGPTEEEQWAGLKAKRVIEID